MNFLTDYQQDDLAELMNIGFAQAANSLSELTDARVTLEAPKISIHPLQALVFQLHQMTDEDVVTVQQSFTGAVSGNALLLLNCTGAFNLTKLLLPELPLLLSDRAIGEVLTEVGNVLFNACLSVFGDLLKIYVSFSVPCLHLGALDGLLRSFTIDDKELRYAVLIHTSLHLKNESLDGYLVLILSVASLDQLVQSLDRWSENPLVV